MLVGVELAIWHLLEVFYINAARSEGFIVQDMVTWLARNGSALDEAMQSHGLAARLDALLSSARPDVLDDYWPCLRHHIALGQTEAALQLLEAHDAKRLQLGSAQPSLMPQYELLDVLYVLVRQMPKFKHSGGESSSGREFDNMAEYLQYRATYQQQCRAVPHDCKGLVDSCAAINPKTSAGVLSVFDILGGQPGTASDPTTNWLEMLVAELVHVHPNLKAQLHLRSLMEQCRQAHPIQEGAWVLQLLYEMLEAILDQEVQRVVEVLSKTGVVSPWFMAHVYEVMRAYPRTEPVIERPLPLFGGDQVEYWRLLFADTLICQQGMWRLAVEYLAWCPLYGADAVETFMEALPFGPLASGGPRQLSKALHVCHSHGLSSTSTVLCRSAAAAAWYAGRLGEAAGLLLRARDERRLSAALAPVVQQVESLLAANVGNYQVSVLPLPGSEELEGLLEHLQPSSSSSGAASGHEIEEGRARKSSPSQQNAALTFVGGFLRLQRAAAAVLEARKEAEAQGRLLAAYSSVRDAIMGLLHSGSVPRTMLLPLLFYAVPFLEGPLLAFSHDDIQQLLRSLSSALLCHEGKRHTAGLHERHVKDVRLALARALARSHVYAAGTAAAV